MKSARLTGAAAAVALHGIVIVLLLQLAPVRLALTNAAPLIVSLLTPPKVIEKPEQRPKTLPMKARVQQSQPVVSAPMLAAAPEAPARAVAPPTPAEPPAPTLAAVAAPPAPAPAAVVKAPQPVMPPSFGASYLQNPAPAYPLLARRRGDQGKVMLRVLVNAGGAADKIEIRSSSGSSLLDDAALEAVKRWRFVPARRGDDAVTAWVLVPITFALES